MQFAAEIAASFALIVYMTLVITGCSFLLIRFRMRAGDLKIRARSPTLATFPAVYAIVVGGLLIPLQELLQLSGVRYSCRLTLAQSWLFLPMWGGPYVLRSLRVLIASNKSRQEKFGFFLRKRTTLAMLAFLCTVAVCLITTLSQKLPPYSRGVRETEGGPRGGACFMMMEWKFLLPFCCVQTMVFGVLGFRLRNVNDLLNISNELRVNFVLYLVCLFPYFVLHLYFRYRTEKDVPTCIQLLISAMVVLAMVNTMWVSVGGMKELRGVMGWGDGEESTVGPSSHGGSVASEIGSPRGALTAVTSSDLNRWKQHYNDVPSIMRNGRMSTVFGALANRFLCSESYDFLVAVSDYRAFAALGGTGPGLQHMLFLDICKDFVVVNSEHEINISQEQRMDVLRYAVYRKFSPLSEAEKGDIFREAEREVSQMLQLNLLLTFHKSAAFAETCAAVDVEEHVWQLEEEKALIAHDSRGLPGDAETGHGSGSGSGSESDDGDGDGDGDDGGEGGGGAGGGGGSAGDRWRKSSGKALLAHLGLSSAVGPSR